MNAPIDTAGYVLVVEDEPRLAAVLRDYLHAAGYRSDWIGDGLQVMDAFHAQRPDLVLLDIMLPGRDGVDLCRAIRAISDVPVIMVTARVEEIDRLLGLEVGADDYICKPFSPKEVIARVGAVLRRYRHGQSDPPVPGLAIDQAGGRALLHGQALDLTAVEFRLLRIEVRVREVLHRVEVRLRAHKSVVRGNQVLLHPTVGVVELEGEESLRALPPAPHFLVGGRVRVGRRMRRRGRVGVVEEGV